MISIRLIAAVALASAVIAGPSFADQAKHVTSTVHHRHHRHRRHHGHVSHSSNSMRTHTVSTTTNPGHTKPKDDVDTASRQTNHYANGLSKNTNHEANRESKDVNHAMNSASKSINHTFQGKKHKK